MLFKNTDHLEAGVIENIVNDNKKNTAIFHIKFKGDQQLEARMDQISAPDKTDIRKIPISPQDFLAALKHLSVEDIKKIQSPKILSPLQIKWKKLHDHHGHTSFAEMDNALC